MPFEIDHVIPTSRGGKDTHANHAPSCRSCNPYKLNALEAMDLKSEQFTRLFDPRKDQWAEHFHAVAESGEIQAQTDIGRATLHQLRINSSAQRAARRQWIILSLFP